MSVVFDGLLYGIRKGTLSLRQNKFCTYGIYIGNIRRAVLRNDYVKNLALAVKQLEQYAATLRGQRHLNFTPARLVSRFPSAHGPTKMIGIEHGQLRFGISRIHHRHHKP